MREDARRDGRSGDAADDGVDDVLDTMAGNIDGEAYAAFADLAGEYGLELVAYEGGPDTSPGLEGSRTNVATRIEAARTGGMADLLRRNLVEAWFPAGGGLNVHFTLDDAYDRYGTYGLTDDVNRPYRNHRYRALEELVGTVGR